jgi:hypothetical protein
VSTPFAHLAAHIVIGARAASDRIVVSTNQKDFALMPAADARDFEVQATNSRDVIGNPPEGVALLLPFVLDVRRSRLQRRRAENIGARRSCLRAARRAFEGDALMARLRSRGCKTRSRWRRFSWLSRSWHPAARRPARRTSRAGVKLV